MLEPRSGRELGHAAGGHAIDAVCRDVGGRHYVKTSRDLHAFDAATGATVWTVPSGFRAAPAVAGAWIADAWVDAGRRRYGIDVLDRDDGGRRRRIELGEVTAFDFMRVHLATVGPGQVAVDAQFAWDWW